MALGRDIPHPEDGSLRVYIASEIPECWDRRLIPREGPMIHWDAEPDLYVDGDHKGHVRARRVYGRGVTEIVYKPTEPAQVPPSVPEDGSGRVAEEA